MKIRFWWKVAWMVSSVSLTLFPTTGRALPKAATQMIDQWIAAAADRESARNQSDQTALADSSNVVVDSTSMPDVFGVGLSLAGVNQQTGQNKQSDSVTVTTTAATLFRTLAGSPPTKDEYIGDRGRMLRSLAFTAGYDRPQDGKLPIARRFGFKWRLYADSTTPGWTDGVKFLPAQVLAAPATAVLRPHDFFDGRAGNKIRPNRFGFDDTTEDLQVNALLSAYEEVVGKANDADPRKWASRICAASPRRSASKQPSESNVYLGKAYLGEDNEDIEARTLEEFFPHEQERTDLDRRSRIGNAFLRSQKYIQLLVCDSSGGLVKLLRENDETSMTRIDAMLRRWDSTYPSTPTVDLRESRLIAMIDAATWTPELKANEDEVPRAEPEAHVSEAVNPADLKARADEARQSLTALIREHDVNNSATGFSLFGEAVVLFATDDVNRAMATLRAYVSSLGASDADFPRSPTDLKAMEVEAGKLVEEINKRTEIAIQFDSKLRKAGDDEYMGRLNLRFAPMNDCGSLGLLASPGIGRCSYWRYLDIAFNAGIDYVRRDVGDNAIGAVVAGAITIPVHFPAFIGLSRYVPTITGSTPRFEISGKGRWLVDAKDQFIGQAKLEIPITDVVSLPISVSIANRREFIDEQEVRGTMGFTLDTSRLLSFLTVGRSQGLTPASNGN